MLTAREFSGTLLTHELVGVGPIPTAWDPNGVYPYPSFCETSRRPVLKEYAFVSLENDFIRAVVCPGLGGRVHTLTHKASGRQVLYMPPVVRPTRILPRQAFLAGGIELSFPISHTPSQVEPVLYACAKDKDRVYVACGERELRFGMHWTVEYSLGAKDRFLTQRCRFVNPDTEAHPWMSWSNAALPGPTDTQFHYPSGPTLKHSRSMDEMDWDARKVRGLSDLEHMTGFFWFKPDVCAFGAYSPGLKSGLYHIADPKLCPGIKLWSYGTKDAAWGAVTGADGSSYVEIQAGPLIDQSVKAQLGPGKEVWHQEFWFPSDQALDIRKLALPQVKLRPLAKIPKFGWARPESGIWEKVLKAYRSKKPKALPAAPGLSDNRWAPSGMPDLGKALAWAAKADPLWLFQLGAWQAGRGLADAAIKTLSKSKDGRAKALEARLQIRVKKDLAKGAALLRGIEGPLALHPQVVFERDLALAALGRATLKERRQWLDQVKGLEDEWLVERRAWLLAEEGNYADAKALLKASRFQFVHQDYSRTALWKAIQSGLGEPEGEIPGFLGEDGLHEFGAYREFGG